MGRPAIKMGAITYAQMIRLLHGKPHTKAELAEATGLHVQTINDYVNALHDEDMIHVVDWGKDTLGRQATPIYIWGMGIDAPRTPKTVNQRQRDWRARRRAGLVAARPVVAKQPVDPDKD